MRLPLAVLLACITFAHASCQGLYVTQGTTGQMSVIVDEATGKAAPVGPSLSSLGFAVPTQCTPSAIDTTGKWYYTVAQNASSASPRPWLVVAAELATGLVRKAQLLPPILQAQEGGGACDYSLTADGSWHAYVSIATPPPSSRLVVGR